MPTPARPFDADTQGLLQDLVALSAGSESGAALAGPMAEALLRGLALDAVHLCLSDTGEGCDEAIRSAHTARPGQHRDDVRAWLSPLLAGEVREAGGITTRPDPFTGRPLRTVLLRAPHATLVAAAPRESFPLEHERLLLQLALQQAASVYQSAVRKQAGGEQRELLRTLQADREKLVEVFNQAPSFMCVQHGPEHVYERANRRYLELVGRRADEVIGKPVHEALPEIAEQGFLDMLDGVYRSGEPFFGTDVPVLLQRPGEPARTRFADFICHPIRDADGRVTGIFTQGVDLTEHRRAETALRATRQRLDLLIDNMRDYAIVITDTGGTVVEWEGGAQRITGYTGEEAIGRSANLIFTDEDRAAGRANEEMRLARETGRAENTRWHRRRDDSQFFAQGVMIPLYDEAGALHGYGKLFQDETRRRHAEQALAQVTAESERWRRLYETVLSSTPDLVYVFDLDHRFTYANNALLRLWGKGWDESIGRNCLELGYEPWHAAMHDREIEQVKATRRPIRGEVPFTGTDGRRIYDYIFVPVLGPDGEVEAVAGTTRDVTERKLAEEEMAGLLAQEQQRSHLLARVARTSRSMGALLSVESIAGVVTQEAREIIGAHQAVSLVTRGEEAPAIRSQSLSDTYAARRERREDSGEPEDGLGICAEVCRSNRPVRMSRDDLQAHPGWREAGRDAASPLPRRGCLAVPLIGHGGINLGVVQLSDKLEGEFTEQDEAVLVQLAAIAAGGIENARLYEQLREQDRRKDEFLATLAHELRNPLAPVRTGLAVLDMDPPAAAAAQTRAMMERQVAHMARLIDDLLDISRITRGKVRLRFEDVELREIADAAVEVSRPLIEAARHGLFVSLPQQPLALHADRTRIAQVISNLLNNAAKYTPEGGRIELSAEREDDGVVIRVRDSGVGLAPDALHEVFEPFTQISGGPEAVQGGLGIGLALVKRLVEMHDGTVRAESDGPGRGSTFSVYLPLATQPPAPPGAPHEEPDSAPARSSRRILAVDDNIDAVDSLAILLRLLGHAVDTVHTGPDALRAAQELRPEIVFLDIGLPGMNGYEVIERLRADPATADMVVVALTGWGNDDDRRRARASGFDQHLTKPVERAQLEQLLAEIETQGVPAL